MDPAELYVAMQQGVIDGFEYPLPDLLAFKLNEVIKYISLDNHTTDFFLVSMNKGIWDGLAPEEQAIINQAMKTAMDWQWKAQPEDIAAALAKLRTLVQVNEITPENKKLFVEATRPVYAAIRRLDRQGLPRAGDQGSRVAISALRPSPV